MTTFKNLYFLLACYAISPDMRVEGYKSNPSVRNVAQDVTMPTITEDDIEKAFSDAKKSIGEDKAQERKLVREGRTVNRRVKSTGSVFHNSQTTLSKIPELSDRQAPFDKASDCLTKKFKLNPDQVAYGLPQLPLNSPNAAAARRTCTSGEEDIQCDENSRYRTIDGTCNNLENPTWGSSLSCFQRHLPAVYDGESGFRRSEDGGPLPEPRILSVNIHSHMNRPSYYISKMYMSYGQFLDHDFALTSVSTTADNEVIECCPPRPDNHPQCAPISIPRNDYFYSRFNVTCLSFVRSAICPSSCTLGPRMQINQLSAYIDASQVYSSQPDVTDSLRSNDGSGMLRVQSTPVGDLLPLSGDPANDQCSIPSQNQICFAAGDPRANQQPPLTSLHTVFVREHNRIVSELRRYNPQWNEETLFQETRKIIGAQMQVITYKEYLPVTIGNERMSYFNLWCSNKPTNYDPYTDATLYTEFATAAFRFGHSLIHFFITESPPQGNHTGHWLRDSFFWPYGLYEGEVEMTMQGSSISASQSFDRYLVPDVTNFLFRVRGEDTGLDLASFNIQRGRDHGLAGYTAYVQFCSMDEIRVRSFDDLVRYNLMTSDNMNLMRRNYRYVNDIDLWTGGVSEICNSGAVVGPTFTCIIGLQFKKLKFADRMYFEHTGVFTPAQVTELKKVTLSKIICDNTRNEEMPRNAMLLNNSRSNPIVPCRQMSSMDLRAWQV